MVPAAPARRTASQAERSRPCQPIAASPAAAHLIDDVDDALADGNVRLGHHGLGSDGLDDDRAAGEGHLRAMGGEGGQRSPHSCQADGEDAKWTHAWAVMSSRSQITTTPRTRREGRDGGARSGEPGCELHAVLE